MLKNNIANTITTRSIIFVVTDVEPWDGRSRSKIRS
jgi:hypothetical protein